MYQCLLDHFPYTVEPGDTIYKIAEQFNTTVKLILNANEGFEPGKMYVGQFINIPSWLTRTYYEQEVTPGDEFSKQEVQLITEMRELWHQHVAWTRMVILSIVENLADLDVVTQRILRNPFDFAMVLKDYYGAEAAEKFRDLLKEHLVIAAELVKAASIKDTKKAKELEEKWYQNADEIAGFMASIDPYWSEEDWKDMLYEHLSLTKSEAVDRINKNYASDVKIYDDIEDQAMKMADTMSEGIIRQFPKKF